MIDDPIPTIHSATRARPSLSKIDAERQAHYDAFYKRTSANIERVMGPRK